MISIASDGIVEFKVYLPHAAKVAILGDFTDWGRGRLAMKREFPGWWSISVRMDAGQHSFCYLIDDAIHMADYAAHGVKMDTDGKWVSSLSLTPAGDGQIAIDGPPRARTAPRRAIPA